MRFSTIAALAAVLIGLALPAVSPAHEGHDHASEPAPAPTRAASRAEASGEVFELVAVARKQTIELFLHEVATNAPVTDAAIEVETPQGPQRAELAADGIYRIAGAFADKPGRLDLVATVSRADVIDILPLSLVIADGAAATAQTRSAASASFDWRHWGLAGTAFAFGAGFTVFFRRRRALAAALLGLTLALLAGLAQAHDGEDHGAPAAAPANGGDRAQRHPDGSVFLPKATQRIFGVRTVITENKDYYRSIELPGRVIPDPNRSGYVQSAVGGRLSPPDGGFPRLGAAVKKGDILAYVTPPVQTIDVSDMRQRQGEIDQQISIVQRRLARYEVLAPSGAVSRSQLEDTRLELEGLKDRRAALDTVRREPEALVAPVSGIVADGSAVAGQIAQSNAVVFHIVDPGALWVEALAFEPVAGATASSAVTAQGRALKLSYRGAGFADRNQSIPVHFAIDNADTALRAGQFVNVLVTTQDRRQGVAVPRSALVRAANGVDLVIEKLSAEIFVARVVRVEPLDADTVLVVAGLQAGRRIVAQGAELIDHVR